MLSQQRYPPHHNRRTPHASPKLHDERDQGRCQRAFEAPATRSKLIPRPPLVSHPVRDDLGLVRGTRGLADPQSKSNTGKLSHPKPMRARKPGATAVAPPERTIMRSPQSGPFSDRRSHYLLMSPRLSFAFFNSGRSELAPSHVLMSKA
jgi:hypothetical protein